MPILLDRPAKTLEEMYSTLQPDPLGVPPLEYERIQTGIGEENELEKFYGKGINPLRGGDKIVRLEQGLSRAYGKSQFKTFLMGHSGVGKTTELSRLIYEVQDKFCTIRFNAPDELNVRQFQPYDIILIMMIKLTEQVAKMVESAELSREPPKKRDCHVAKFWLRAR